MHTDQSYWDDLIDTETSKENLDENSDAVNFSAPHMVPSSTGNAFRDQLLHHVQSNRLVLGKSLVNMYSFSLFATFAFFLLLTNHLYKFAHNKDGRMPQKSLLSFYPTKEWRGEIIHGMRPFHCSCISFSIPSSIVLKFFDYPLAGNNLSHFLRRW